MYYCDNCNTAMRVKRSRCEFCGEGSQSIKTIKKSNVTITEIILNYNIDTVSQYFPSWDLRTENQRRLEINPNYRVYASGEYFVNSIISDLRRYPLGLIHNHMDKFLNFEEDELSTLFINLFGKKPYERTIVHVMVKTNLLNKNEYMFVPMRIESIVKWFKDQTITFETTYYRNSVWVLDNDTKTEEYQELLQLISNNQISVQYYGNYFSSENIL